ncbi:gliding motility-associated C-terminal domain-containing protein [Mucilaginibacter pallidiroseus]|uniref:gliding motility-associated C-terminal domain-containing protein n=1 Tax=Mucilaginibacter pallidiroseus TaxID=2599295 RepID=UPI0016466EF2|nr:gliding motility-associated C-terminal domain-containing protein [Mucilaginibacter pallidiroseus]
MSIIFAVQTHAETFTVTSNGDSGPGTLREALTKAAANGDAEKDFIYFNLPDVSEAGRTIAIKSLLPKMTSNLVIDGSTQPGANFGVADAKVQITYKFIYPDQLNLFYSDNANLIEIYGLYLNCDSTGWGGAAIGISNFDKVIIGAPSKGNMINGANVGIHNGNTCIYQSNNSGTDPTGETVAYSTVGITCADVTVGGAEVAGNVFFRLYINFDRLVGNNLILSHNKFGTNYNATKQVPTNIYSQITRCTIQSSNATNPQPSVNALIADNIFVDEYVGILLSISNLDGQIKIKGNGFNTDRSGTINYLENVNDMSMYALILNGKAKFLVGGDMPDDKNFITYAHTAIAYTPNDNVILKRNSIFCVRGITFLGNENEEIVPKVKITSVSVNGIAGTATPNTDIELLYSNCNCYLPAPKTYFATVKANATGSWSYVGPLLGNVMASATSNRITGMFAGTSFNEDDALVEQTPCSNTGTIKIMNTVYNFGYRWYNSNNELVATTPDLIDVAAGVYTLKVGVGSECDFTKTYEIKDNTITVTTDDLEKTNASCNSGGSLKGIKITSQSSYRSRWIDKNGSVVCDNCLDLTGVPAGQYSLVVGSTTGQCEQIFGPYELQNTNGVQLVTTNVSVRPSTCGLANGYIRGLQAPGATTFIWTRDDGSVAGNTLNLENIPPGNYRLTISNATCANYADFRIDAVTPTVYPQFAATITKTCAAFPTGTISINTDGAQDQPGIFRWVDSQNNTAGYGKTIQYLPAGTYKLYLTDAGSCESFYKEYTVDAYPELTIAFGNAHDIYCGVGKGSIDAAIVSGGTGNYFYEWKDGNGNVIPGKTQPFINDLDAGTYTLSVTDGGCNLAMLTYTIKEQTQIIPAPIIADVEVTRTGNTTLQVTDPFPTAIYRLYDSETGSTPLAESKGGSFTVNVTGNRSYYIELSYGECESPRTRVRVVLTILNVNIPNTFTPNGDGFNDYWTITGIEESKIATVKIFARSGQMVFQSVGYPKPFDGTQNGQQLPASTYYYIIEQKNAKPISGYVTILR